MQQELEIRLRVILGVSKCHVGHIGFKVLALQVQLGILAFFGRR